MATNEYMKQYMAKRRIARRNQLIELLGSICRLCDSTNRLQFDHIDRSIKKFTLSGAGLDKKWQTVLDELAKCQLLCSECHKNKTIDYKDHGGGQNKLAESEFLHGTMRMYDYKKCRCELCRLAKKKYRNKELTIFAQQV
jgi:hypothetical protein